MLPVMDRVFGTFYLPKAWPSDYGASTPVSNTMVGQMLDPFARMPPPAAPTRRTAPLDPRIRADSRALTQPRRKRS